MKMKRSNLIAGTATDSVLDEWISIKEEYGSNYTLLLHPHPPSPSADPLRILHPRPVLLSKQFIVAIHVLLLDFLFFIGLLRGTISSSHTLGDP